MRPNQITYEIQQSLFIFLLSGVARCNSKCGDHGDQGNATNDKLNSSQFLEVTALLSELSLKDENCYSPEPGERGFTYLQVVSAFSRAKQVMTSDTIKCSFIPFPDLQIKSAILPSFVSNKLKNIFFQFVSHFTWFKSDETGSNQFLLIFRYSIG